jgi:hypothetical protein
MLGVFPEDSNDLELRELFNVCWYPSGVVEGLPAAPDVQSMPGGVYGNIFDVLVDRPARAEALLHYPVVWAAGDADLAGLGPVLEDYLKRGGTLVVNAETARHKVPDRLLGFALTGTFDQKEAWTPEGEAARPCTPYLVERGKVMGAKVLAWADKDVPLVTRHAVGEGAVILVLAQRMLGLDERAHPCLPFVMNGVTAGLLPVDVRLADGSRPRGEVMYQVNKTKDGLLVTLVNVRGIDKTQTGLARVDRRAFVDVVLHTKKAVRSAREVTGPSDLAPVRGANGMEVRLRIHPGDVQVVSLATE